MFVAFGSNVGTHGQRLRCITMAIEYIRHLPDTRLLAVSSLYETPPWGVLDQPSFYNGVIAIRTGLAPRALLKALKRVEQHLGRIHRQRWGPREIDLDILYMGNLRLSVPGLQIPHPEIANREFVRVPLHEIMRGTRH